jgi:predicted alpha/beta hydrolase
VAGVAFHGEQFCVPVRDGTLFVRRFAPDEPGDVVFMLHGSLENGRIFYSRSGRGLAPYLAQRGFDVFAPDLRGRGSSTPRIARGSSYGQTEAITEDLPALLDGIRERRPEARQHWVAHSWGGVLLAAFLARFPHHVPPPSSVAFFATKRRIAVTHLEKRLKIDLAWRYIVPILVAVFGYLPARRLRFGADSETRLSFYANRAWVREERWVDPADGFDYGDAVRSVRMPPLLSLVGANDSYLGHPHDVSRFLAEIGAADAEHHVLSRARGNLHDYGHIDILTHPDAPRDHFPMLLSHLRRHRES